MPMQHRTRCSIDLVGRKHVVPERLTNKTSFKQWRRRYKMAAGAKDDRLKTLLVWA